MANYRRNNLYAKLRLIETILILLFFALCTIPVPSAFAATVNLAWKASTGSNVDGYKMYYGTSSRNYSYDVNVGNSTSCSLSGLQEGRRYYFATTAYNTSDVESDYSPELSYTIPTSSTDSTSSSGSTSGSGTTGSTSGSGTTGSTSASGTSDSTSASTPADTGGSSGTIIIDNGDPNTKAVGSWAKSDRSGYYGANSLYSNRSGDTYSFEAASSGAQEVYLWYAAYGNRCTNVPIEIYDGNTHLDSLTVNQQQDGGQWNLLGTYTFSGTAKIITVSTGVSNCVTSADAVSLVPTDSAAGTTTSSSTGDSTSADSGDSSGPMIIDNGYPNTDASGYWRPSTATGFYGANSLYSNRRGDTYSFEAARSGAQEVYLWHAASGNRCTDVPIEIYDGNTRLDTVTINQQQDGGQWNLLGTYSFSGTATVIVVSTGVSNCVTSADAVGLVSTDSTTGTTSFGSTGDSTPPDTGGSSGTIIVDNGDLTTVAFGRWRSSTASGFYGANSLYSNRRGDTYSFEAACSGDQEVYLWHAASGNRCPNVPIEIYDGNIHLDTLTINQQQDGGQWNLLGTYTFSGTARIITISTGVSDCVTSADAVYFFEPN